MKVKRLLMLLGMSSVLLTGCGEPVEETPTEESTAVTEVSESSNEEPDTNIKEEAIEVDFVEINSDNVPVDTAVHVQGTVTSVFGNELMDTFTLTTEEGDGLGMYEISILDILDTALEENTNVEIWGTYKGKSTDTGIPQITGTVIEVK